MFHVACFNYKWCARLQGHWFRGDYQPWHVLLCQARLTFGDCATVTFVSTVDISDDIVREWLQDEKRELTKQKQNKSSSKCTPLNIYGILCWVKYNNKANEFYYPRLYIIHILVVFSLENMICHKIFIKKVILIRIMRHICIHCMSNMCIYLIIYYNNNSLIIALL